MDLRFKTFGQGPPLIILHGLFGTLDNWQTLGKRWANDYTVFLIDQRNHGRSPHVETNTYIEMAEDLHEFMEANWMYKAHIIGHSMGGKTAMQFATSYPSMVDKLVIVDIAPKSYEGGHEVIINALNNLPIQTLEDRKVADAMLEKEVPDYGVRQFLLKNLARNKEGGFRWKMNLPVLTEYYPTILQNIEPEETFDGLALFIGGGNSKYIQPQDEPVIKKIFPQAKIKMVAGAGHWVHAEAPDALFELVSSFLVEE